ncbi:MAG: hypothetical protein KA764_17815 [Anaerolineales bacterium]|nr:hypothetical protein [Anaerolineales bacterium]
MGLAQAEAVVRGAGGLLTATALGAIFLGIWRGAQLFADHQLVTRGPFAIVRHPMYAGIAAAALGGLLLDQT